MLGRRSWGLSERCLVGPTLAIFIALNVLNNPAMSIPAAVYSLIMFFTAAAFAFWLVRRGDRQAAV